MSFLSDLEKTLRTNHILVIVGAIVLVYAVYTYSDQKFVAPYEPLQTDVKNRQRATVDVSQHPAPAVMDGMGGVQAGAPPAGAAQLPVANPADILPRDSNNTSGEV